MGKGFKPALIGLIVVVAVLAYLYLSPGGLPFLSRGTQPLTPDSSPKRFYSKIETCIMSKEDPLVLTLEKKGNAVTAMLLGDISKLDSAEDGITLELNSLQGDQQQSLFVKKGTSVFDSIAKKDAALSDLKVGQRVYVGISCTTDTMDITLKVTQVAITTK